LFSDGRGERGAERQNGGPNSSTDKKSPRGQFQLEKKRGEGTGCQAMMGGVKVRKQCQIMRGGRMGGGGEKEKEVIEFVAKNVWGEKGHSRNQTHEICP